MAAETIQIITPDSSNYQAFRDFSNESLDPLQIDSFKKAAVLACRAGALAPTSHGFQQYGLRIGEKSIFVGPDLYKNLEASDSKGRQMYEGVGTVAANIKITLRASGWLPETKFVTNPKTGAVYQEITIHPGYQPTAVDRMLAEAIPNRVNYDGNHLATPIPDQLLTELQALNSNYEGIDFTLVRDSVTKKKIGNLIQQAGGIIFRRPFFTNELVSCLRDAVTNRKDGLLTSKLEGLPKFVRRFAPRAILTAAESFIANATLQDRNKTRMSAGIGVFSSNEDNPVGWMKVGEYLETAVLIGVAHGVYSGIRAALIETDELHLDLEKTVGTERRAQAMIRLGFPEDRKLHRGPRFPFEERLEVKMGGEWRVPPADRPTIFKIGEGHDYRNVQDLLKDLGHELSEFTEIDRQTYLEHDIPDLFSVLHPELIFDPTSASFLEQLEEFVQKRSGEDQGVWVYNPKNRTMKHYLGEKDFYQVKTANNSAEISERGQEIIYNMKIAIAGLSGSGYQAMMAAVMSGAKYLTLADFDFTSLRNKGRKFGKVGENKAYEAAWAAWEENPFLEIEIMEEGVTDFNVKEFVAGKDLVNDQIDSEKKFTIREAMAKFGKEDGILMMVTDFLNPVVEWERKGDGPFGGRAKEAGIDGQKMSGIISIAESTVYLPVLMGPEDVPAGSYDDFRAIATGQRNAYSQLFVSTQAGGAATGAVLIAMAEGTLDQLPNHYVVHTRPQTAGDLIKQQAARKLFEEESVKIVGRIT